MERRRYEAFGGEVPLCQIKACVWFRCLHLPSFLFDCEDYGVDDVRNMEIVCNEYHNDEKYNDQKRNQVPRELQGCWCDWIIRWTTWSLRKRKREYLSTEEIVCFVISHWTFLWLTISLPFRSFNHPPPPLSSTFPPSSRRCPRRLLSIAILSSSQATILLKIPWDSILG